MSWKHPGSLKNTNAWVPSPRCGFNWSGRQSGRAKYWKVPRWFEHTGTAELRNTTKTPSSPEDHCAVNHSNWWVLLGHGRSNCTNWVFVIYLFHKAQQKVRILVHQELSFTTFNCKGFCPELWSLFPTVCDFCAQMLDGSSCLAWVIAIWMANPKLNVLNQFSTQTTLHGHYRDATWSSIKMTHNLLRSYTTNNSQQSPLLQNMK